MKLSEIVLLETVDQTFKDDLDIASFLVKNCSEWQDFSKPLWRYTESKDSEKPALRSTRVRSFRSMGSTGKLQDYIFALPEYKGFPDRAQSIFCSTTKETAMGSDELKAILPLDGAKIGQTENDDFNFIKPIDSIDMYGVYTALVDLFRSHNLGSYLDLSIDEILLKIGTAIKEDGVLTEIPDRNKKVYFLIRNGNFKKYFSPDKLGLHLVDAKTIKHLGEKQTEVWFEGKYISLPYDWFVNVSKLANRLRAGETEEDIRAERKIPKTVKALR